MPSYNSLLAIINGTWKYRWRALQLSILISVVGGFGVARLPDEYQSSSVLQIESDTILSPLLQGLTVENGGLELGLVTSTLKSLDNLEKIAGSVGVSTGSAMNQELSLFMKRLGSNIRITPGRGGRVTVSYVDTDPVRAHDVTKAAIDLLLDLTVANSISEVDRAVDFLDTQIAFYAAELEKAQARLSEFRRQNYQSLGGQPVYLARIEDRKRELAAIQRERRRSEALVKKRQSELERIESEVVFEQGTPGLGPTIESTIRILELEEQVSAMLTQYTEKHPDVVLAQRKLADLYEQLEAATQEQFSLPTQTDQVSTNGQGPTDGTPILPNPNFTQTTAELDDELVTRDLLVDQEKALQEEIRRLEEQAARSPVIEAQLAKHTRDFEIARNRNNELLLRREQARISRHRSESPGQMFSIVEQAAVPTSASGPPRRLLTVAVFLFSIGAGIGTICSVAYTRDMVWSAGQLKERFGIKTISVISTVQSRRTRATQLLNHAAFGSICGLWVACFVWLSGPGETIVREQVANFERSILAIVFSPPSIGDTRADDRR